MTINESQMQIKYGLFLKNNHSLWVTIIVGVHWNVDRWDTRPVRNAIRICKTYVIAV
jgi:hypothetical protein